MSSEVIILLIIVGLAIAFILAIREIIAWYFKINEMLKVMKETNVLLENLTVKMRLWIK